MRILFSSTKGLGHLRPLLPYALAARARGHSVCVATPDGTDQTLKSLRLEHTPFATPADADVRAVTAPWQGLPAQEFTIRFATEVFGNLRPRAALPAVRQTIHEWRPDLVVRESAEFAAAIAAEEAGLPHARVAPHCGTAEMGLIALATEPVDKIRREVGLKPDEGLALRAAQGFTGFPASLDGTEPAHVGRPPFRVRHPPQPIARDGRAPWAESDGRPLVYISFGTETGSSPNTRAPYRLVVETVSDMPVRALLTTGPNIDMPSIGLAPKNVAIEAWVPQGEVWPHVTAFLCHEGRERFLADLRRAFPS
jgi:UDP:flavonoid glycosyltransferase YjiC (YdhE family)